MESFFPGDEDPVQLLMIFEILRICTLDKAEPADQQIVAEIVKNIELAEAELDPQTQYAKASALTPQQLIVIRAISPFLERESASSTVAGPVVMSDGVYVGGIAKSKREGRGCLVA